MPTPKRPNTPTTCRISVRVKPRARETKITALLGDTVQISLNAPPVDGSANQELLRFLAKALHLRLADLDLVAGKTGRNKIVQILDLSPEEVQARLRSLIP